MAAAMDKDFRIGWQESIGPSDVRHVLIQIITSSEDLLPVQAPLPMNFFAHRDMPAHLKIFLEELVSTSSSVA